MNQAKITVRNFQAADELGWSGGRDKWRVTCSNDAAAAIFVTWDEIEQVVTELKVTDGAGAGEGMILNLEDGICRSYVHVGSREKRIAPHRFLEIRVSSGDTASWSMAKPAHARRFRFSIRTGSLEDSWTRHGVIPEPEERIQPIED